MRKSAFRWAVALVLGACTHLAAAQLAAVQNHCILGGKQALLSGMQSTNFQQGIIPACTVTVYVSGTQTKALIYADSNSTPLPNPFTANVATSQDPGGWIFWATKGQGVDVVLSGGGGNPSCTTAPNCYAFPVTLTDVIVGGGGGSGYPAPPNSCVQLNLNGNFGCLPQVAVNPNTGQFQAPSASFGQGTGAPGAFGVGDGQGHYMTFAPSTAMTGSVNIDTSSAAAFCASIGCGGGSVIGNPTYVPYFNLSGAGVTSSAMFMDPLTRSVTCSANQAEYSAFCYSGVDPSGVTDSTASLLAGWHDAQSHGKVFYIPSGTYKTSYPIVIDTSGEQNGPRLHGDGIGRTEIMPSSTWTCRPTDMMCAVLGASGVQTAADYSGKQLQGFINDVQIIPYAGQGSLPACDGVGSDPSYNKFGISRCVSGIGVIGVRQMEVARDDIRYLTGDAVVFPAALWIGLDPDFHESYAPHIHDNYMGNNYGWCVNIADSQGVPYADIGWNLCDNNGGGFTRWTGWQVNIHNNASGSNGCSATGTANTSCRDRDAFPQPLEAGVRVERAYVGAAGPINQNISNNEFDTQVGGQIYMEAGALGSITDNRFIVHTTQTNNNPGLPNSQNIPTEAIHMGTNAGGPNEILVARNFYRSGTVGSTGFPTPSPGAVPNPHTDPSYSYLALGNTSGDKAEMNNTESTAGSSSNAVYDTDGGGIIANTVSVTSGAVSSATLNYGGWGYASSNMPTFELPGGDDPTTAGQISVTVDPTYAGTFGIIGCTTTVAGSGYHNTPLFSIYDASGNGSGATIHAPMIDDGTGNGTLKLGACVVDTPGSGYDAVTTFGNVTPQCATTPTAHGNLTYGVVGISMSRSTAGDYGAFVDWSSKPADPSVVITSADGGTGALYHATLGPVNTVADPTQPPNIRWQVVGITRIFGGYGYSNTGTTTVTFSPAPTCSGCLAATGSAILDTTISPSLAIDNAGSGCDGPLTIVVHPPLYNALSPVNNQNNLILSGNVPISQPPPPASTYYAAHSGTPPLDRYYTDYPIGGGIAAHVGENFAGNISSNFPSTKGREDRYMIEDDGGGNNLYLSIFGTQTSSVAKFSEEILGAPTIWPTGKPLWIGTGSGVNQNVYLESGGTIRWGINYPNGDLEARGNGMLGTTTYPAGGTVLGTLGLHATIQGPPSGTNGAIYQLPAKSGTGPYTLCDTSTCAVTGSGVTSYNGRTGAVTPASGDYTAAQVTNAADKSSSSTQVFSGTIQVPTGSATAPSLALDSNGGFYKNATSDYMLSLAGAAHFRWETNFNLIDGAYAYGWGSSGVGSQDTCIWRKAAKVFGFGACTTGDTTGSLQAAHLIGGGATPTVAAGTGAGTSPTITTTTATDLSGYLNVTTGTSPTASATVVTVTFAAAFTAAPKCHAWPANAAAAALSGTGAAFISAPTTTAFTLTQGSTALAASTAYVWGYECVQ